MHSKNDISDLVSLLKVFDANYASDDEYEKLANLDANNPAHIAQAVQDFLVDELRTYLPAVRVRLIELVRSGVADTGEDFAAVFARLDPVFGTEIVDRRAFMTALWNGLQQAGEL